MQTQTSASSKKDEKEAENPRVYLDFKIGDRYAGRLSILLRADIVPKTAGLFTP